VQKITQKQAKAIKQAVADERTIDQYTDYCIRDEKGRFHVIDDVQSWGRFLGKPVAVTCKPRLFVVQLDRDDDTAEKVDDWEGVAAFRELAEQQTDLDDDDADRFQVFVVGWDIGADGKPAETTIFEPHEAAALDRRVQEDE